MKKKFFYVLGATIAVLIINIPQSISFPAEDGDSAIIEN